jgi:hypothetical protein
MVVKLITMLFRSISQLLNLMMAVTDFSSHSDSFTSIRNLIQLTLEYCGDLLELKQEKMQRSKSIQFYSTKTQRERANYCSVVVLWVAKTTVIQNVAVVIVVHAK